MLGFWYGLCSTSHSESPKISNLMFQLCSKFKACDYKLPWLMKVHSLLDSLGLSYRWVIVQELDSLGLSYIWVIVQEVCESRGGRPGLSVLTNLLVSVDVKNY